MLRLLFVTSLSTLVAPLSYAAISVPDLIELTDDPVSRAGAVKAVVELNGGVIGQWLEKGTAPYNDVSPSHKYFSYFMEAGDEGWLTGDEDCFGKPWCEVRPDEKITRAEMADLAMRAFFGRNVEDWDTGSVPLFPDNPVSSPYHLALQAAANNCFLLPDDSGKIRPEDTITRLQMIALLNRVDNTEQWGADCGTEKRILSLTTEYGPGFQEIESGDTITLIAKVGFETEKEIVLHGMKPHQVNCSQTSKTEIETVWLCRALSPGLIPSEISASFEDDDREMSNVLILKILPAEESTTQPETQYEPTEEREETEAFPDLDAQSLEGKAAEYLRSRGIINGYPDGEFKANRYVNRGEAAKMFILSLGEEAPEVERASFKDYRPSDWFARFVERCQVLGIITGHPDGTFRPGNSINTAEFLAMLSRAFALPQNLPHYYSDVSANDWYGPLAGNARQYDLFPGRTTFLEPAKTLSRGEFAVALYQYLKRR